MRERENELLSFIFWFVRELSQQPGLDQAEARSWELSAGLCYGGKTHVVPPRVWIGRDWNQEPSPHAQCEMQASQVAS